MTARSALSGSPGAVRLAMALALCLPLSGGAAVLFFDPLDTAAVPALLSQTGVFTDMAEKTPDTALKPFEINAPFWSDGAAKRRWIVLPPGKGVPYADSTDLFDYPDSALFVKNFHLDFVEGDAATRVLRETRLLVNRKDANGRDVWHGFSYKWNAASTEAHLVSLRDGFDTAFAYHPRGLAQPQSYRKWRYPSQEECNRCHVRTDETGSGHAARGVLGFFPAQLKRPAPGNSGVNQVHALFAAGVFTGTPPLPQQLARRWKGIHEQIPPEASPDARFRILDTMARSYLGANCSGCHGDRGIVNGTGVPAAMNFDFFDLYPRAELGHLEVAEYMEVHDPDAPSPLYGRGYFVEAVARAGLDTSAGSAWNMALPPSGGPPPAFVYPGFTSMSLMLYRQLVRRAPWRDSVELRRQLEGEDPQGWSSWMFSEPWGSEAWRALLAQHGVDFSAVAAYVRDGGSAGGQMPPVAVSFVPDTAALKVLAEWVRSYRTLYVVDSSRIITATRPAARRPAPAPLLRGRLLVLPPDWTDPVALTDARGRSVPLLRGGAGMRIVPASTPRGVYVLRAGGRVARVVLAD